MKLAMVLILFALFIAAPLNAQPEPSNHVADYLYFSDSERTEFDEIIWFWQRDLVSGPVRSNSQIAIKNNPIFYGVVITTASRFLEGPGFNPRFLGPDPILSADSLRDGEFDGSINQTRSIAIQRGHFFGNENGQLQSRIVGEAGGWHVWQWPAGTPFPVDRDFVVDEVFPYTGMVFFFEGNLELHGRHIQGFTTIGCGGRMRLLDDVIFNNMRLANIETHWRYNYVYDGTDRLALLAGQEICVANTIANGKGNGAGYGSDIDHSNKHIQIAAQMLTPNGSFTFENQNNRPEDQYGWDGYYWCDPEGMNPNQRDERGVIYLYGAMAQKHRGYVHRSNCGGTGYEKFYVFDDRFVGASLPAFIEPKIVYLNEGDVLWQDTTISITQSNDRIMLIGDGTLTLGPGTRLEVSVPVNRHMGTIFYGRNISLAGTPDNPVEIVINQEDASFYSPFELSQFRSNVTQSVRISGTRLDLDLPSSFRDVSIHADVVNFSENPFDYTLNGCHLRGCILFSGNIATIKQTVVEGHLSAYKISSAENCTFVHVPGVNNGNVAVSSSAWSSVSRYYNLAFEGPFVYLISTVGQVELYHSSWFQTIGGSHPFSPMVTLVRGNLPDVDPLFWDAANRDYHLTENSPLIDAGDPGSPLDPDGTRADIGAFPYDPTYTETPETDPSTGQPLEFAVEKVYPNPFNGMTTLSLKLPRSGEVRVTVFDVLGREVVQLHQGRMAAGRQMLALNLATQPSGLYFVVAEAGKERVVAKAMLVK